MGYRCCFNIPACIYLLPLQRSNFTETQPYRWRGPGPNKPSPPSLLFNSHLDRQRQSPKPLGSRRRTRRLSTSSSSHRLLPFLGFLLRRRQSGGGGIMTQIREPVLLEVGVETNGRRHQQAKAHPRRRARRRHQARGVH